MYAKTDREYVLRDLSSKAVVSTDHNAKQAYQLQKQSKRMQEERLSKVEDELVEIKDLLRKIIKVLE